MGRRPGEYETIFETAEDAIFLYDVEEIAGEYEFELRRLNPAHEAASGLSIDDHHGESPRETLGETQGAEVAENLRRCANRQETISYEEVLDLPAGRIRWRTKLSPVIEEDEVVQIVGIARDITEKRERETTLRDTRARLDLALEATDTGVWEWNIETDAVVWNEALERLVGIEPGSFAGTFEAFAEYLHPDDETAVEQAIGGALDGDGSFEAEFRMVRDDGEPIWVLGRGELYTDDGPRRMIGTTTDITTRKESQRALDRRETLDLSIEVELHSELIADVLLEYLDGSMHLSIDGIVPGRDESRLLYVTVSDATPREARATIDLLPTGEEATLLSTHEGLSRYEVRVDSNSVASIFARFDGVFHSLAIEDDVCKLIGEFPETVDPEAVADAVRETYPDAELAARSRIVSPTYLRSIVKERLTERQQTVLGMAYYAGYFEQPRGATGEELASRLDITRQTFNTHLRKAQAELLEELFEGQLDFQTD